MITVHYFLILLSMAYYKPVSRWTRKRRTENDLSRVFEELHNDDDFRSVEEEEVAEQAECCEFSSESESDININLETELLYINKANPEYSLSESESDSAADSLSLSDEIADWALNYNIPHVAVTALLDVLRKAHPDLPKDSRTILNTDSAAVAVKNVAGGSYYHFGLEHCLSSVVNEFGIDSSDTVELHINIDGLPLHNSTNAQFWPILGLVTNSKYSEPFVIGIFHGNSKPLGTAEYIHDFVSEYIKLQSMGITCNNKTYKISLTAVICDAPARSFIKSTKGHAGYYGCDKCAQEGSYIAGRMTFPDTDAELRDDNSFRAMLNDEHHTGYSPFTQLPIDMISTFPLDYMHLICLGVMRKLMYLWIKGPLEIRLGRHAVNTLSATLIIFREQVPREFSRKPRSLAYLERWKATELRQFLLYTGMISLHGVVDDVLYNNFMLLSVAMYILLSPQFCHRYSDYAGELLKTFVKNFGDIYGKQNVSYNVHATVHLANEAKIHGPLDNISGFVFENYLGKLKKLIRKPHAPLQQVVRRLSERRLVVKPTPVDVLQKEHCMGPVLSQFTICRQYREYHQHEYTITLSCKDNCALIGSSVALVRNFLSVNSDMIVVYQKFSHMSSLYTYPVDSTEFEVYTVADLDEQLHFAPLTEIRRKCVILSHAGKMCAIPFIH